MLFFRFVCFVMLWSVCTPVFAHELTTGFLLVQEEATYSYSIAWKMPTNKDNLNYTEPVFPDDCSRIFTQPKSGRNLLQWRLECKQSLSGRSILLPAMNEGLSELLVQIKSGMVV